MKNIWMLTKTNLRKSKSQTFSMFLLITIAAMFLNIGLVLYFGVGSFFDERAEELNTAHFVAIQPESEEYYEQLNFIQNFHSVTEVETQNVLVAFGGYFPSETLAGGNLIISNVADEQTMNPPALIGDSLPLTENAVYIPHFMFLGGGFSLGDDIRFEFAGEEVILTVAGSTEEILFGDGMMNNVWRIYVSSETFLTLSNDFSDTRSIMMAARMTGDWALLSSRYGAEFAGFAIHYGMPQNSRTMIPMLAALMVAFFAFILLVVASIVARFRINNDIEESMVNIGALKAVGYRNYQIIMSIVIQFGVIALIGGLVGALLSQVALPMIAGIMEPMLALPWNPAFNIVMMLVSLAFILLMILLFAYVTSRRIKKLHPLIALRGGITTHNFKKNSLPLDKTRGSLSFLLALKQILRNKKQAIMLSIIVGALTFVSSAGLIIHYNVNVDMSAFLRITFGATPDVAIVLNDAEDLPDFFERLKNHPDVVEVYQSSGLPLLVNEETVVVNIYSDFSYIGEYFLISGRFPILPSEVVMDTTTLSAIGKNVGDFVTIRSGDLEQDFIITGHVQMWGGLQGMMSIDALHQIQPDFMFTQLNVNLEENASVEIFMEHIRETERDIIAIILSVDEQVDAVFSAMGDIFAAVNVVIMVAVAGVVVLVLYLLVKTMIIRRKRELGTQKALGFTTLQLMNQIALGLTPTIIIGALLGAIGGYIGFNPIFVIFTSDAGIVRPNLHVPTNWIVMTALGLAMIAYAVAMLISWRIRKISAYALVSER